MDVDLNSEELEWKGGNILDDQNLRLDFSLDEIDNEDWDLSFDISKEGGDSMDVDLNSEELEGKGGNILDDLNLPLNLSLDDIVNEDWHLDIDYPKDEIDHDDDHSTALTRVNLQQSAKKQRVSRS